MYPVFLLLFTLTCLHINKRHRNTWESFKLFIDFSLTCPIGVKSYFDFDITYMKIIWLRKTLQWINTLIRQFFMMWHWIMTRCHGNQLLSFNWLPLSCPWLSLQQRGLSIALTPVVAYALGSHFLIHSGFFCKTYFYFYLYFNVYQVQEAF